MVFSVSARRKFFPVGCDAGEFPALTGDGPVLLGAHNQHSDGRIRGRDVLVESKRRNQRPDRRVAIGIYTDRTGNPRLNPRCRRRTIPRAAWALPVAALAAGPARVDAPRSAPPGIPAHDGFP